MGKKHKSQFSTGFKSPACDFYSWLYGQNSARKLFCILLVDAQTRKPETKCLFFWSHFCSVCGDMLCLRHFWVRGVCYFLAEATKFSIVCKEYKNLVIRGWLAYYSQNNFQVSQLTGQGMKIRRFEKILLEAQRWSMDQKTLTFCNPISNGALTGIDSKCKKIGLACRPGVMYGLKRLHTNINGEDSYRYVLPNLP